MSEETARTELAKKTVVYRIPEVDAVEIRRDVEYRNTDAGGLTMDLYYPPDSKDKTRMPAVMFVLGFSDVGSQKIFGCKLKDAGAYISWAQLAAASGLIAVTYATNEPARDIRALFEYLRKHAEDLRIDEKRLGVWACSGNAPMALSVLMEENVRCAVLCYGFLLDLDGATGVADGAKQWGFVNPCAGKTVDDLPQRVPLFIARAGQDQIPHLNKTMDRFVAEALTRNLPITVVNHPEGPHAFDLFHDSERSREIIQQILAFMQFHLAR